MRPSLYLASQSPRRRELLQQVGFSPTVLPLRASPGRMDIDETPLPNEPADDYVLRLARLKLAAGLHARTRRNLPDLPLIAADTTVAMEGHILGKPAHADEATAMLRRYSGKTHEVFTAVGVAWQGRQGVVLNTSRVTFKSLNETEIATYVASGEPFDKAGGYGIQGRAALLITRLEGSYSGVMGLPLFETGALLREVGFHHTA